LVNLENSEKLRVSPTENVRVRVGHKNRVDLRQHVDKAPEARPDTVIATVDQDGVAIEREVGAVALPRREYVEQGLGDAQRACQLARLHQRVDGSFVEQLVHALQELAVLSAPEKRTKLLSTFPIIKTILSNWHYQLKGLG
jgi:hypothetical protein